MHIGEGNVFQFIADLAHAQAIGDGGVNFQGFAGDLDPLFIAQGRQGADVVQAVGQLDQDDPHVGGHGDDHFF